MRNRRLAGGGDNNAADDFDDGAGGAYAAARRWLAPRLFKLLYGIFVLSLPRRGIALISLYLPLR